MDFQLTGNVAIVTGASRGIGRAVAQTLSAEGMHVVAVARSRDQLETLSASLFIRCLPGAERQCRHRCRRGGAVRHVSGYLAALDRRTLLQNVALTEKYDLPVSSVLVLLHPHANSPRFNGRLQLPDADANVYLQFAYRVVQVWELDAEALLKPPPAVTRQQIEKVASAIERIVALYLERRAGHSAREGG